MTGKAVILVTGGAGYIGSHTCKALARAGYLPVSYDSLETGNRWAVKWGPFEHGDIADQTRLLSVIHKYKPSAVIHFAASAYVGESIANPAKYYRNNVVGTLGLLEAMRLGGVRRIVFSSTCATYGIPDVLPISESAPQSPINPYGHSKLMVEQILKDYVAAHGLSVVALRYFNACGADADMEIGESHDPETHLVPLVMMAALDGNKPVTIFGTDYPTKDGTCIRDYIHVTDLATAHVLALEQTLEQAAFAAVNLGTGKGHSVREIINAVARHSGREVNVVEGPRRPGDPAELVASPQLASGLLGWAPEHSDLDNVVRTAWSWITR